MAACWDGLYTKQYAIVMNYVIDKEVLKKIVSC